MEIQGDAEGEGMATDVDALFVHNREWAAEMERSRPGFFTKLTEQQQPKYMWIGCSDSRVPANQITGLEPGEVFVHRNVANLVVATDLNCLSTVQYAVDVLRIKHLMVVGHYGCGGVTAAMENLRVGLADNWLRHIKDVRDRHWEFLREVPAAQQVNALCDLNVIEQVMNVAQTTVIQDAWDKLQNIQLHGWVYGLKDGLINDLDLSLSGHHEMREKYQMAIKKVEEKWMSYVDSI